MASILPTRSVIYVWKLYFLSKDETEKSNDILILSIHLY